MRLDSVSWGWSIDTARRGRVTVMAMVKLLKQILIEERQDLKRLTHVLLLLTLGTITTQYLAHRVLPGAGLSHFTVRASPYQGPLPDSLNIQPYNLAPEFLASPDA